MMGGPKRFGAAVLLFGLAFGFAPASASSKDRSPITEAEQDTVFKQGELSAKAEACGLDWQKLSFRPMMAYWRRQGKTEEQMTFIGIFHGAGQGYAAARPENKTCTEAVRRKVRAQLPFKR